MKRYFSSEHVSPGHPDKVMDSIAEALVDEYINQDGASRIAVDGVCKNERVILVGEVTTRAAVAIPQVAKKVINEIGYNAQTTADFNDLNVKVEEIFTKQSPDIKQGVDVGEKQSEGAGDQGIVVGGAIKEAPDFTGHAHYLARLISYKIFTKGFSWAKPDQKTQVTIEYDDNKAVRVSDVVVAIAHQDTINADQIRVEVRAVVEKVLQEYAAKTGLSFSNYKLHVNSTGKFVVCGPIADSGEVGRKIVCDQYGGYFPVGGGNLNGKDPSKVDRTGVYMARYVSKQLVAQGYADKVSIEVGYVIGEVDPVSVHVDTYGTEHKPIEEIEKFVAKYSFRPTDMMKFLQLRDAKRPFEYKHLGMFGHIGESFTGDKLPWEKLEKVEVTKAESKSEAKVDKAEK